MQAPLPAASTNHLELHLRLVSPLNDAPVAPVTVVACSEIDPDCSTSPPLATGTTDQGAVLLSLRRNTTGSSVLGASFFDRLLVTSSDGEYDAFVYFFPPPRTPTWVTRRLVSKSLADETARSVGETLDWKEKGGIAWSTASCNETVPGNVPGVRVELSPGERVYYYQAGGPEADAGKTGSSGLGFAWNITPGAKTLTATLADGGDSIGTYRVRVAAGRVTHLIITPVP